METLEFDSAYSATTGEHVGGLYIPTVTHDDGHDITLDGCPLGDTGASWHALTGYTRQHGYRGAVMHASETMSDDAIREAVRDAGGDVFALVEVSACDHGGIPHDDCDCDACEESTYCQEYGCDSEPAGWAVIYRDATA